MIIELDENELESILILADKITACPTEQPDVFCKQAKDLSIKIPERIRNILLYFVSNGSATGFLLCKYIPINDNPVTPSGNNFKMGEKTMLAKVQSLLINVIGEMISYEGEGYGRLFQDVVPVQNMAKKQTSVGSNVELEIHTEQAFSKLRPDILSLACLRGDIEANTYILPVHEIINNLNDSELELLRQPLWKTGVDLSFKLNGNEFIEGDIRGPIAIIQGSYECPILVFDQDLMTGITEESDKMISKIVDIYYKNRVKHNLTSGEIIFIDNRYAVHGRSSFFPKYDGKDRFLIRCFAVFDFEYSKYARSNGSRSINAIYS